MRAAILAALLVAVAAPAAATVEDRSALATYARARVADSEGALDQANESYSAALALAPGNEVLAARALGRAILAGDRPLALQAARALEAAGKLGPDGRLLLLGEAFRTRNWRSAGPQLEAVEKDEVFSFMVPILRAWLAQGSGKGDPFAALQAAGADPLAKAYAAEHRTLILLARGEGRQAAEALAPLIGEESLRSQRLRIATAALLARKGDRKEALSLLTGEATALVAARRRVEAGKRLGGEIKTAADGMAELMVRMSLELNRQDVPQLALSFARIATFIEPQSAPNWLVTAELLAGQDRHEAALKALDAVAPGDVFAGDAAERRVLFLVDAGRGDEALVRARAATAAEPDDVQAWSRLGDVLNQLERHGEAADAYAKALELVQRGGEADQPAWGLWLLRGSALTQAGRWPEGKAALEEAYKLSPRQAVVLNFLGYSQLERRENLAEAERLIREASELQPDDLAITDSLGWAHYVRGDLPKAVELLERAAQGQPADSAINEHLGDAYYSAGRRYEARYAWEAALAYAEGKAVERLRAKIEAGLKPDLAAP